MNKERQEVYDAPETQKEQIQSHHRQLGVVRIGEKIPVNAEGIQDNEKGNRYQKENIVPENLHSVAEVNQKSHYNGSATECQR
jgi:hypothetical protein